VALDVHRIQAARQRARGLDGFPGEIGDAPGFRRFRRRARLQPVLQRIAEQGDAGQVLAQAVVQILPDPPALAR